MKGTKRMKVKENVLSVLLAICLILTWLPTAAFAEDPSGTPMAIPPEGGALASGAYALTEDVSLTSPLTVSGSDTNVTIDLNGFTLDMTSLSSWGLYISGGATCTICDSSSGNGKVEATYLGINNGRDADGNVSASTLNITGGTLTSSTTIVANRTGATASISNATLKTTDGQAIQNQGTITMDHVTAISDSIALFNVSGAATLNNCTLTSDYEGVEMWDGTLQMNGCQVTGASYGLYAQNGTAAITDCDITSGWCGIYAYAGDYGNEPQTYKANIMILESTVSTVGDAAASAIIQWGGGCITVDNSTCKTANGNAAIENHNGTMDLKNGTALYNGDKLGTIQGDTGKVTMDNTVIIDPTMKMTSHWTDVVTEQPDGYTWDSEQKTVSISSPEGLAW